MDATAPLVIRPLQWSALPELHDAPPIDDADLACLAELRAVLARHGKLDRFAVHLAHRHLKLAADEMLIERPDPDGRTQHVTVGRRDEEPDARPTTWLFDGGPELHLSEAVYCVCLPSGPHSQGACVRHGKSPSPGEHALNEERVKQRRIGEENARYEQGMPVAGHEPRRRRRER